MLVCVVGFLLDFGRPEEEERGGGTTDFTTCGAMTLQGPHHVAKQSRTTTLLSLMVEVKVERLRKVVSLAIAFVSIYLAGVMLFRQPEDR